MKERELESITDFLIGIFIRRAYMGSGKFARKIFSIGVCRERREEVLLLEIRGFLECTLFEEVEVSFFRLCESYRRVKQR